MKERAKRFILLIAICIFTLILLFIALKLNEKRKEDILSVSNIDGYLTEINYDELSTHVIEQPNTIIYISNSSDDVSRKFEKVLKKVIKKYNLENEMIYININNTNIIDPVYSHAPSFVFYNKGQIEDIINCSDFNKVEQIIKVLEERSVIND